MFFDTIEEAKHNESWIYEFIMRAGIDDSKAEKEFLIIVNRRRLFAKYNPLTQTTVTIN